MNPTQQRRAEILSRLTGGSMTTARAAELLGVSPRQTRRLRARYQREGMAVVVHGLQGRPPTNQTDPAVVARIIALVGEGGRYHDFNVCHLQEMLAQEEPPIRIGRSTLDRLLRQHQLRQPRRRPRSVHRRRRTRATAEGMLLQVDGSPHDWLEGRGPWLALMAAIDDARGTLVYGQFRPTEDQAGYLLMFRTIAGESGLPMAVYHDRHTILRSPKTPTLDDELAGRTPMSQVQRLLAELGIEAIAARSPQAKGRIERLWRTLQDRLTKELRLAGIATIEAANAFLPGFIARFNARFGQEPADPQPAWVALDPDFDLDYYFAARETRTVRADHTITWLGQTCQILPTPKAPPLVAKKVTVHVLPDDTLRLYVGKQRLAFRPVDAVKPKPSLQPIVPSDRAKVSHGTPSRSAKQRAWLFGDQQARPPRPPRTAKDAPAPVAAGMAAGP
jgi:hypothetical protein